MNRYMMMYSFLARSIIFSTWLPTFFAVTSSTWGAIRYYLNSCNSPSNLLYIESFPLNVCYKTGNLPYYKKNTVIQSGVSGCPSCWHYVRQQYSDANCIIPSTQPFSMVYRDTSSSCGLINGAKDIYARYCIFSYYHQHIRHLSNTPTNNYSISQSHHVSLTTMMMISTTTYGFNYANTGVTSSDSAGAIRY